MGIFGSLAFAALFYAAAEYEHLSGWKWAIASFALSLTVRALFPFSFVFVLPAQFGLFLVMWWMNSRKMAQQEVDRATREKADQRIRQERARLAREQVDPEIEKRAAAREALEEAQARERKERVRLAREEREREEREKGQAG